MFAFCVCRHKARFAKLLDSRIVWQNGRYNDWSNGRSEQMVLRLTIKGEVNRKRLTNRQSPRRVRKCQQPCASCILANRYAYTADIPGRSCAVRKCAGVIVGKGAAVPSSSVNRAEWAGRVRG